MICKKLVSPETDGQFSYQKYRSCLYFILYTAGKKKDTNKKKTICLLHTGERA